MREDEIIRIIKSNDYLLLGQIEVSDEKYGELLGYAKEKMRWINKTAKARADLLMSLFMVQVAIRKYEERAYWKKVKEEIGGEINQFYLGETFIKTIKEYNLAQLDDSKNNKYVENIKIHAFVTNGYMQGYFDFAYAFFENNLFRQLNDSELNDDIEDISEYMESTLDNDSDIFECQEGKRKASKTYKLLKASRVVFAKGNIDTIVNLFKPTLDMIDKYYYDNEIPNENKNRFAKYFVKWCKNNESLAEKKAARKEERNLASRIPYIEVRNPEDQYAKLIIPPQKFRKSECDGEASVQVKIAGYPDIEEKELDLGSYFGMYISEKCEFIIPNIFGDIEICILPSEKQISIKNSNYRVFNEKWKHIPKLKIGHNYILVKKDTDVQWNNESDLIDQFEGNPIWNYYSVNITEESICYIGGKPVSIIGEFSYDPVFEKEIDSFNVLDSNGDKIISTREHPSISFVIERYKLNGTSLLVNGERYHLYALKQKMCYDWPSDNRKIAITVNLNEVLDTSDGKYHIELDVPGEVNKKVCEYLLLTELKINLNRPRYMYEQYAYISYDGKYDIKPLGTELDEDKSEEEKNVYRMPLTPNTQYATFELYLGETYIIQKEIRIFLYGNSPDRMQLDKKDYIWYKKLGQIIYIKMPGASKLWVCLNKSKKAYEGVEIEPHLFQIDITEIEDAIRKSNKPWNYINVNYIDNRVRHMSLPPILRSIYVNPYFKLRAKGGKAYIDIEEIKGEAELFLSIRENQSKELLVEHRKIVEGINYFPELEMDKLYDLYPITEESTGFFGDTIVTRLKTMKYTGCIDMNNLVNCRLPIKSIMYGDGELKCKTKYVIDLFEKSSTDEYVGMLKRMVEDQGENTDGYITGRKMYKNVGCIRVQLYIDSNDISGTLLMYSKEEEEYIEPYYDNVYGNIIHCDSIQVKETRDYNRFETLFEDETIYVIDEEKLRRNR